MENIRDFFDELAPRWNNSDNRYDIIDNLLNRINILNKSDVLDLGCGKGVITPKLYNLSHKKVDAIDLSERMIEGAKIINNDTNKYNFICGDFFEYNFNKKYDYIVIFNAYPHFLDTNMLAAKAYELLNDGGKLVIMHDIGRGELNTHHKQHAMRVSRPLDKPETEYKSFINYFNLIEYLDETDSYFMMMEKK